MPVTKGTVNITVTDADIAKVRREVEEQVERITEMITVEWTRMQVDLAAARMALIQAGFEMATQHTRYQAALCAADALADQAAVDRDTVSNYAGGFARGYPELDAYLKARAELP